MDDKAQTALVFLLVFFLLALAFACFGAITTFKVWYEY